jgi:hypothetical protein
VPQSADLGAVVVALDAAREVAAGDRGGRAADVVERAEADPDEPQPESDERPKDDEGHDGLDRDEPVQGRVDLVEGRCDDEHRLGALLQRGPDAVGAALPARHREVPDALAPLAVGRRLDRVGKLRVRLLGAREVERREGRDHLRAVRRAQLNGDAGRRAAVAARSADGARALVERLVGAVEQERAERGEGDDVREDEPGRRERDHRDEEPRPERQRPHHSSSM